MELRSRTDGRGSHASTRHTSRCGSPNTCATYCSQASRRPDDLRRRRRGDVGELLCPANRTVQQRTRAHEKRGEHDEDDRHDPKRPNATRPSEMRPAGRTRPRRRTRAVGGRCRINSRRRSPTRRTRRERDRREATMRRHHRRRRREPRRSRSWRRTVRGTENAHRRTYRGPRRSIRHGDDHRRRGHLPRRQCAARYGRVHHRGIA